MDWIPVPATAPATAEGEPGERKYDGFHAWDLVIILTLATLATAFISNWFLSAAAEDPLGQMSPIMLEAMMWFNMLVNLVLMGALPLAWVMVTRIVPWEGAIDYLGMRNLGHSRFYWLGLGSLLAVGLVGLAIGFQYGLDALGVDPGGDNLFERVARDGSWALMVGIAVIAGVSEEILFRGVLQKWLRWWGQGLVFGVVHVNQGWWAVGFIVALSSVFGILRDRGMPLWALMWAHFAYDLILLTMLKLQVS